MRVAARSLLTNSELAKSFNRLHRDASGRRDDDDDCWGAGGDWSDCDSVVQCIVPPPATDSRVARQLPVVTLLLFISSVISGCSLKRLWQVRVVWNKTPWVIGYSDATKSTSGERHAMVIVIMVWRVNRKIWFKRETGRPETNELLQGICSGRLTHLLRPSVRSWSRRWWLWTFAETFK